MSSSNQELGDAQSLIDGLMPGDYEFEQIYGEFWGAISIWIDSVTVEVEDLLQQGAVIWHLGTTATL